MIQQDSAQGERGSRWQYSRQIYYNISPGGIHLCDYIKTPDRRVFIYSLYLNMSAGRKKIVSLLCSIHTIATHTLFLYPYHFIKQHITVSTLLMCQQCCFNYNTALPTTWMFLHYCWTNNIHVPTIFLYSIFTIFI